MDAELLIPISFFAMIAALAIVPQWLKSKERQRVQETLRAAYERGQPVDPAVIEAMTSDVKANTTPAPFRDVRRGVIFLAVALAFTIVGFVHGYFEGYDEGAWAWYVAVFPGLVGLAYLILGLLAPKRS
jgi:hypothetical protein